MLLIGLLCGALLGLLLGSGGWIFGAIVGAVLGWLIAETARLRSQLTQMQSHGSASASSTSAETAAASATARVPATRAGSPAPHLPSNPAPPRHAAPAEAPASVEAPSRDAAVAVPAPPRSASAPRTPKPNPALQWMLGGNTVVRVGVVILFCGVAFLFKFAYDHTHIPIEVRLIGVAIAAIVLLAIGWRLRLRNSGYALTLQGGGVGLLYLTIFAAFRIFSVIPAGPAFGLLVILTAFAALLAVVEDSLALAVLGIAGGFLAPILASTGNGSHVLLFSYYLVLNLGIVLIAWKKAWRVLNLLGFAFTFGIGLTWGAKYYQPDYFSSSEPFLVMFFLLYVAIPVLFARHRVGTTLPYVDGTLVIGVPIAAFGLQAAMVHEITYGTALSALAMGSFYVLLASALWTRKGARERLLAEAFIALGCGFATLAIPLAFDGRTTSAAWAVEGAGAVWLGLRQGRFQSRLAGYALQAAGGVAFVLAFDTPSRDVFVLNSQYLGCALLAISAWFCSAYATRKEDMLQGAEQGIPAIAMLWGSLWWVFGGLHEINRHIDPKFVVHAALVYVAVSALLWSWTSRALSWPVARWGSYCLLPALCFGLLANFSQAAHPFAELGYAAWAIGLGAQVWILWRAEGQDHALLDALHMVNLWLIALLLSWEMWWQISNLASVHSDWGLAGVGLVPTVMLWGLSSRSIQRRWPVAQHRSSYVMWGGAAIAGGLLLWTCALNISSGGDAAPIRFIPLFNPLDVSIALAFLSLIHWFSRVQADPAGKSLRSDAVLFQSITGAAIFLWINGIALRTVHHWASVPFDFNIMWRSVVVQATLSLLWTLISLLTMAVATHRSHRMLWMVGAGLMTVVVAKLVLVDLSSVGAVERIISFIGVGILMLVIGYIAPVPPRVVLATQEPKP
jgi:uncharacterized membrane protein